MRVEVRIPNLPGAGALCEYARERLLSVLGYEGRVAEGLVVSLTPVGDEGLPASRCRMVARISPSVQVAVQETNSSPHVAIDKTAERLAAVLVRRGGRARPAPADAPAGEGTAAHEHNLLDVWRLLDRQRPSKRAL